MAAKMICNMKNHTFFLEINILPENRRGMIITFSRVGWFGGTHVRGTSV